MMIRINDFCLKSYVFARYVNYICMLRIRHSESHDVVCTGRRHVHTLESMPNRE